MGVHGKIRVIAALVGATVAVGLWKGWIPLPEDRSLTDSNSAQTAQPTRTTLKPFCGSDELPETARKVMTLRYISQSASLEAEYPAKKLGIDSYQAANDPGVKVGLKLDWKKYGGSVLENFGSQTVTLVDGRCVQDVKPGNRFGQIYIDSNKTIEVYAP